MLLSLYYLSTGFAFCMVKYYDQGFLVWSKLARSVHKDRGVNALQHEKLT